MDHFKQALSMDPLLWAAYEELCILGLFLLATTRFMFFAVLCYQYSLSKLLDLFLVERYAFIHLVYWCLLSHVPFDQVITFPSGMF